MKRTLKMALIASLEVMFCMVLKTKKNCPI